MLRLLLVITLLLSVSNANLKINNKQLSVLQKVYNIGKKYKTKDGLSFEKTLSSIYLAESNAGMSIIGDNYTQTGKVKSIYESSLGAGQIQLRTAQKVLNTFPKLKEKYKYLIHNHIASYIKYVKILKNINNFQNILKNPKWKNKKTKKAKNILKWAKFELNKNKKIIKEKYWNDIIKDNKLINKLLIDVKFSATISVHYLIMNYQRAQRLKISNPYFSTISLYNGGFVNHKYYNKIMRKMRIVKKLIKNNRIKN